MWRSNAISFSVPDIFQEYFEIRGIRQLPCFPSHFFGPGFNPPDRAQCKRRRTVQTFVGMAFTVQLKPVGPMTHLRIL